MSCRAKTVLLGAANGSARRCCACAQLTRRNSVTKVRNFRKTFVSMGLFIADLCFKLHFFNVTTRGHNLEIFVSWSQVWMIGFGVPCYSLQPFSFLLHVLGLFKCLVFSWSSTLCHSFVVSSDGRSLQDWNSAKDRENGAFTARQL